MNRHSPLGHIAIGLVLIVGLVATAAPLAQARPSAPPVFNVNVSFDNVARPPLDDGVCDIPIYNGPCTLRAAISKANHYPGGGATINIPAGIYTLTIAPSGGDDEMSGDLNITNTMTINGASAAGTIVDANQIDRVISVGPGTTVTISNVTIRHGLVSNTGGGISNSGALTVNNSVVSGNQTLSGSSGGGVFNASDGTLVLNNMVVSGNQASGNAGGVFNDIFGIVTLNNSAVRGNQTVSGGYGGGMSNSGALTLNRSLVSDNQATGKGGGIANFSGTLTQTNSTVSNNSALGDGGAIWNSGTVNAFFSTIAGNLADNYATGAGTGGGIYNNGAMVNLRATILGQNYVGPSAGDCSGSVNALGNDLIESVAGCMVSVSGPPNLLSTPPFLDSLRDNGGPTATRALLAGSPAIDAIPVADCVNASGAPLTVDQRGFPRPSGSACDIGAYEGSVAQGLIGVNLIRNGDAEGSAGSPTGAVVGEPYWSSGSTPCCMAVVPYGAPGGFPLATDPGPLNRGLNFFAGGVSSQAQGHQVRNLGALAAVIDAGLLHYDLSGYFGGYANQDDHADLVAYFVDGPDGVGNVINSTPVIGDVLAANRGYQTGLLWRGTSGLVPAKTRSVDVYLTSKNAGSAGTYNDGYADNLSLVLYATRTYLPLIVR